MILDNQNSWSWRGFWWELFAY